MTNQERIKEYLVGENGYLKNDALSNGKVIMLFGKWGCGKTHFWQNKIATQELKEELKDKKQSYSYISLYGKSSIEEIESDIFGQIYFDALGGENVVTKTASTFTKYSKRYGGLIPSFDLSKLAKGLEEDVDDNKERIALERLENGGIICFDDFERKSKEIDLNDLFGFITQLTLNFQCKVVIILNDDVFEGEEKQIFSNVKEKTVSKFLQYSPIQEELFSSIFEAHTISNKKPILTYIKETNILNARIYIQVLDNIFEYVSLDEKYKEKPELRCLILCNINFILYHTISEYYNNQRTYNIRGFYNRGYNYNSNVRQGISGRKDFNSFEEYSHFVKNKITDNKNNVAEKIKEHMDFFESNIKLFESEYFINKLDIAKGVDEKTFNKINQFIETGILIDED